MFLLRRASIYRPGHWADDDYDVYDGERNVGRIFWAEAGHPAETPWMWTKRRTLIFLIDLMLGYCRLHARACYHSRQPWAMVTSVALG